MAIADLLVVEHLSVAKDEALALSDISLAVEDGTALALLGRRGAGKTTLLESIVGVTLSRGGSITLAGREIGGWPPEQRAAAGIGWVPQGRAVFQSLSVDENIRAVMRKGLWTRERIYGVFPPLGERRHSKGGTLGDGEQQMLAIGRALALNPLVLMLDEPLEGIAPVFIEQISKALRGIVHDEGMAVIVTAPVPAAVLPLATQAIVLEGGRIAYSGSSDALANDGAALDRLFDASSTAI